MLATRIEKKKAWRQLNNNATSYSEKVFEATSHKAAAERPPIFYL